MQKAKTRIRGMISIPRMILIGVLFTLVIFVHSGCSPSQRAWVDRCRLGLDNTKETLLSQTEELLKQEDKAFQLNINAAYADILMCASGQIKNPETGEPIEFSKEWLGVNKKVLEIAKEKYVARRTKILDDYKIAMENIGQTEECLDQIERLNKAWATDSQNMAADMNYLIQIVDEKISK